MSLTKKPFMVEFSGTPESGKTTTIQVVSNILRNAKYNVEMLRESAELLPNEIPKGTFQANMWMHFITQAGVLRVQYLGADVVLIDRGIIDSEFYGWKFRKEHVCTVEEYEEFRKTFLNCLKPNLFVALMVKPEEAIKRRGGEGSLVTREYVQNYNELYIEFFQKLKSPKEIIKTDNMEAWKVSEIVANLILGYLK